jgi:hypothetical protein
MVFTIPKHVSDLPMYLCAALGGRGGRDCMVVGFTTTYAISAHHH